MPRVKSYNFPRFAGAVYRQLLTDRPKLLAVDTETTGASYYDEVFCVTFSWRDPSGSLRNGYIDTDEHFLGFGQVADILDRAATSWESELIFHNAKFDLEHLVEGEMLDLTHWTPERIHDTEAIWHLLYPNELKGLKHLAVHRLGRGNVQVPIQSGKNKGKMKTVLREDHELGKVRRKMGLKKSDGYHLLPRVNLVPYAMRDTEYTYLLYELGYPKLVEGLLDCYRMEQQVAFALMAMESAGARVDVDYLQEKASEFGVRIMEAEGAMRKLVDDPEFLPSAPAQVQVKLEERGITVPDTEADTLKKYPDDELCLAILEYRYLTKMHKNYLRALLDEQRDGIVHAWIRQHGAKTGRTASGKAKPDG